MHLLVLPTIGTGRAGDPVRPDLRGIHEFARHGRSWGQASCMTFGVARGMLVYVSDVDERVIELLLRAHDGGPLAVARYIAACATERERRQMHRHLLRRPRLNGERLDVVRKFHKSALADWVAAYRGVAEVEESRERARRSIMNLTVSTSDSFSAGGSNDINGMAFDKFAGGADDTWNELVGSSVESGGNTISFAAFVAIPTTNTPNADQRTTITPGGFTEFAICRATDVNNFYFFGTDAAGGKLYKRVGGSDTQLGSAGSAYGTTVGIDCQGTSIAGLKDGAVDVGPVTDSAHASGKAGVGSLGFSQIFDYKSESYDVAPDPPNASYAADSQPCEGSDGTITPTNTGGAITSSAMHAGSPALPTGYVLNANGTISKTGASMVVGDIGARTCYVDLTNAAGTQSNVPVSITITANPPVISYAGSPFDKRCAYGSTTANVTQSGATPNAYALSSALGGLSINSGTGQLTFNPTLAHGTRPVARTVTATTAGGQSGTATISVEFHYEFTVSANSAADSALVTMRVGSTATGDGSSIRSSAFRSSSNRSGHFQSSTVGRGSRFR